MTCGVYMIQNTTSGRVYVGSSVDIERRWKLHRYHLNAGTHHSSILQKSWRKHGEKAFVFEVVAVLPASDLLTCEQHLIDHLLPSFNIHVNSRSPLGVKRSMETRRKLSALKRGSQPAQLAEYSQQCIGKPAPYVSESNRRRMGIKKHPHSPETRAKISLARRGKPNLKNRGVKKPWLSELNRTRSKVFGAPIQ